MSQHRPTRGMQGTATAAPDAQAAFAVVFALTFCSGSSRLMSCGLSSEHCVDSCEHQFQLAPRQFADAFGQLPPVDCYNQRYVSDRFL